MKREGDIFMFFNVFTSFLLFLFSVPSFKKTKSSLRLFLSAQCDRVRFFFSASARLCARVYKECKHVSKHE